MIIEANKVRVILILPALILTLVLSGCFNKNKPKIKKAKTSKQISQQKGY